MAAYKVLMTYDFSIMDEKSLSFVINTFSYRKDAHITLFSTYTPLPEIDPKASPELAKMNAGMAFLSNEIKEKEKGLADAKTFLMRYGFSSDQVDYVLKKRSKSIAKEIIDQAMNGNYQVVVLSRQPGKVTRYYALGMHNQLLTALNNVTVCIPV